VIIGKQVFKRYIYVFTLLHQLKKILFFTKWSSE